MIDIPLAIMMTASLYFAETPIKQERTMIAAAQLREMIVDVLETAPGRRLQGQTVVELLMLTAATESRLGTYYRQVKGPALGIMQMEPPTAFDIYNNFLLYPKNADLKEWVEHLRGNQPVETALKYNLAYQIAMARIHYWRVKSPLPKNEVDDLAIYWKKYFNTPAGRGTVEKAAKDYELYAFNTL